MKLSLTTRSVLLTATILGLLLPALAAQAVQLYKYQDEEGVWHFSDSPPQGQTGVHPSLGGNQAEVPQQQVIIHTLGEANAPHFEVSNTLAMPIELEFSAKEMHNMRADPPLPIRKVIGAHSRESLTRFEPINPELPWSYSYKTRYVLGDPEARHLTGKPYVAPFSPRKEFSISQAFDGEQSHRQDPLTRYAVDIPMPGESTVHAARSGTVVEITRGKLSPKRKKKTFYVRILHHDGTFGLYAHLDPDTVKLLIGMTVNRGQVIGRLEPASQQGKPPHLHFAVQKNTGMKLESIPFNFARLDGNPVQPKTGLQLRHPL